MRSAGPTSATPTAEIAPHLRLRERYQLYADLRKLNPVVAGEGAGLIILHHDTGPVSLFDGNRLSDHVAENRRKTMGNMLIEGESGTLRLDGDGRLFFRSFGTNGEAGIPFQYEDVDFGGGCVEALNRHLVAHVMDGEPLENRARDYLHVLELEDAAYRSASSGQAIRIGG